MILQTDPLLNDNINDFGCYFMTILFLVNKHTGRGFDRADINHLYDLLQGTEYMDEDCFMENPVGVFNYAGLPMKGVMITSPRYKTKPGQIEFLRFERTYFSKKRNKNITYGHFVVGAGSHNVIAYDPAGNSNAVKYGKLESKRIFTRRD